MVTVGLHWLEIQVERSPREIELAFSDAVARTTGRVPATLLSDGYGNRFYRKSMSGRGVWMGWDNVGSDSALTYVQFKGEAFETYGGAPISAFLKGLREDVARVVRVDVAFDGVPLDPEEWYLAWKAGECTGKRVDYLENKRGHAARVGALSRGSSQASMYDERGSVRLEFRTRNRRLAGKVVEAWLAEGDSGVASAGLAGLRGHLGKSWGKLDEWLGEGPALIGGEEPVEAKKVEPGSVKAAAKLLVLHGMRYKGARTIAESLAMAAKFMDGKTLDAYGIDWRKVADEMGRFGPEGFNNRVTVVRDVVVDVLVGGKE